MKTSREKHQKRRNNRPANSGLLLYMREKLAVTTLVIMLALRTVKGIGIDHLYDCCAKDEHAVECYISGLVKHGYAVICDGNFHLTPEGMLVSNTIIGDLLF